MITKKRIQEIRRSPNLSDKAERELIETIEKGQRISRDNEEAFRRMLSC